MGPQFDREFMLNTALRTSLRDYDSIVGYVFLDVCYVLQFYREELAEPISHNNSLIILDHPWSSLYIFVYFGLFWNHLETWHIICISFVYHLYIRVSSVISWSVLLCYPLLPRALLRGKRARGLRPQNGEVHNEDTTGKGSPKGEKGRHNGRCEMKNDETCNFYI